MNDTYYLYQMLQILKNPNDISLQVKLEKTLLQDSSETHQLIGTALRSKRLSQAYQSQLEEAPFEIDFYESSHCKEDEK